MDEIKHDQAVELYRQLARNELSAFDVLRLEESLKGRKVVASKDLDYGNVIIPIGTVGTIYDFGASSGAPIVKWMYQGFESIADLGKHCILLDSDSPIS